MIRRKNAHTYTYFNDRSTFFRINIARRLGRCGRKTPSIETGKDIPNVNMFDGGSPAGMLFY